MWSCGRAWTVAGLLDGRGRRPLGRRHRRTASAVDRGRRGRRAGALPLPARLGARRWPPRSTAARSTTAGRTSALADGAEHVEGAAAQSARRPRIHGVQHVPWRQPHVRRDPAHADGRPRGFRVLRDWPAPGWLACAAIPPLDVMTARPAHAHPITQVMPMGGLMNVDRTARSRACDASFAVGDALCHTDPAFAYGLSFALVHAAALAEAAESPARRGRRALPRRGRARGARSLLRA